MDKHYDVLLAKRLKPLVEGADGEELVRFLSGLSNAQFRTAGYIIGERLAMELDEDAFWQLAGVLCKWNARAFLGTMLVSATNRLKDGRLNVFSQAAIAFCSEIKGNEIDVQKTLLAFLPLLAHPSEIDKLFLQLGITDTERRLPFLLRTITLPAAYSLLLALRYLEHDRALLVRTVYHLMKRGDDVSFNIAALLRAFFGLEEIRGTFSLRIEPFELARIEQNYDVFLQTVRRL